MGRLHAEDGVGLTSSVAGVMVFLAFLLLAAQILVHLFATSYVNAAAYDAARLASGSAGLSEAAATEYGLTVLGSFAERVSVFTVEIAAEEVRVHVEAESPALLPAAFGRAVGSTSIDRNIVLRRELGQCAGC